MDQFKKTVAAILILIITNLKLKAYMISFMKEKKKSKLTMIKFNMLAHWDLWKPGTSWRKRCIMSSRKVQHKREKRKQLSARKNQKSNPFNNPSSRVFQKWILKTPLKYQKGQMLECFGTHKNWKWQSLKGQVANFCKLLWIDYRIFRMSSLTMTLIIKIFPKYPS